MKKFILAALAATVATTPVLAQGYNRHDNGPRFEQRHGFDRNDHRRDSFQERRWNRGDRFDSRYARNYRVIGSPRGYRLYDAPRGYRWVQSGNDAVLVGITSGLIAAVMANAIH